MGKLIFAGIINLNIIYNEIIKRKSSRFAARLWNGNTQFSQTRGISPRPVPLSKIASEGISEIWMATGEHSVKTKDFRSNPKAGLCFYEQGNSVALTGEVEVVTDAGLKQKYWQDWFIAHFPKGPTDPEYVLLKFRSEHATFWIDGQFVHRNI